MSFVELAYALKIYISGESLPGWASIVTVMTFLFGFLFILIGILGAYLSRIHRALQAPPRFIISETSREETNAALARTGVDFNAIP